MNEPLFVGATVLYRAYEGIEQRPVNREGVAHKYVRESGAFGEKWKMVIVTQVCDNHLKADYV